MASLSSVYADWGGKEGRREQAREGASEGGDVGECLCTKLALKVLPKDGSGLLATTAWMGGARGGVNEGHA